MSFPNDFVWGAATAAYQIEGAALEDGKGPSIWDMLCRKPGAIWRDQAGDTACDHYHRFKEDVALMKSMGLGAYRLSLSWPRILPAGTGAINASGLAFYDALVDELLGAGITPYVTLYHWDLPYELYCRGGWLSADSPRWFADYADLVVRRLSDRVRHWLTFNEPQVFVGHGLMDGVHAPGDRLGLREVLRAMHHVLLAHGRGVQAIRAAAKEPAQVSYAACGMLSLPATGQAQDVEAARLGTFAAQVSNLWNFAWFSDPIFLKRYPASLAAQAGAAMPAIGPDDMDLIGQPLDFQGLNIYTGERCRAGGDGQPEPVPFAPGYAMTGYHWPLTPESLYWGPRFMWERYQQPVIITENGMANVNWVARDGRVHDPQRIDFTTRYLLALRQASEAGVPVRGYFHWSLLDNFEWAVGFQQRFGLVHVDYATQRRTLKDSALWYHDVIGSNGASVKL
jgi:beta-glucosidase